MATYRLWPSATGPAAASDSTSTDLGVQVRLSYAVQLDGFFFWLPAGCDTNGTHYTFRVYSTTTGTSGSLVSGTSVTGSGTWTAGAWNYTPLGTPAVLAAATYCVVCSYPASGSNHYGATASYWTSDLASGPLTAPSAANALGGAQQAFNEPATGGFPSSVSSQTNYWVDLQVEDLPPPVSPPALTARPGPAWRARFGPSRRPRPQALPPSYLGSVYPSDADSATASEAPSGPPQASGNGAVPGKAVPGLARPGYPGTPASSAGIAVVQPPSLPVLPAQPGAAWRSRYHHRRDRPRPQVLLPSAQPAAGPVLVTDADSASAADAGEALSLSSAEAATASEAPGVVFGSVQAAQVNSAASVTSQASSLPAGVTQGSLVVACLAAGNNATSVTPPDASWRQAVLNQPAGASATIEAGVWYLVVDAAHAGQSSWTWTFSASHTVYVVTREWYCSAGWPSSPADVTAQGDTAGTPAAGTAVSSGTTAAASSAPELEVAALAYKGTAQAETGLSAGWSQGLEATLAANNTLREAYRVSSAPEAASAALSVGTAQFWAGAVAVFAPGPGSPSDSDAASASESGEAVAASPASSDAASGAEAGEQAALSSPDAASAAESGETASLASADAASAADAGEAAGPLGSPGPPVLTRQPGAAWAARYGPPGRARPQFLVAGALPPGPPAVFDSDGVHAEDSGFAVLSDAEAASAADGGEAAAVASAETSSAAEAEKAAWPQDRDAASAAEAQHWSGPLSDPAPEQGRAADGGERLALASAEASSATDAAPVVEVYSFQPPFRWDGGGFELVWHAADGPGGYTGITVWRGPLPDGAAFRVWKVLSAASRVILVTDADTAAAREEHDPAIAGVSVSVAPAVTLLIQAG